MFRNGFPFSVVFFLFLIPFFTVNAADVAVVVPEVLQQSLVPWTEYRTAQGYTIHLITEPLPQIQERIKERLQTLAKTVSLSAILLVGNGAARVPKHSERVIPSPRFASRIIQHFGEENHFACDDWYADVNNDGFPDCPIGRFPVDSAEELTQLIQKVIRYETQIETGIWCRRIQLVAGLGNFSPVIDNVIESTARYILTETVPGSMEIALLHANWKSPFCPDPQDFRTELVETLNRGSLFWCYLGHGHHRQLDPISTPNGRLPTLEDGSIPVLHCRDALPIVLLLCCYGGTLDASTRSLAEEFVLQPEGPVAAVAASRTTMPYGMSVFGLELLHEFFERQENSPPPGLTLGQLIWAAKRRVLFPPDKEEIQKKTGKVRQRPVRETLDTLAKTFDPLPAQLAEQREEQACLFNLFGDPLLVLPVPKSIQLTVPSKVKAGQTVSLTGFLQNRLQDRQETPLPKTVRVELVPALGRISLQSPRREEFRLDAQTRQLNNEEYCRSKEQAIFSVEVPLSGNSFAVDVSIPKNIFGIYVFRVFGCTPRYYAAGSAEITVRPAVQ